MSAQPLNPPSKPASVTAQPWSEKSGGMPVIAQPMKVIMSPACITRSTRSKRL
ncbi:MAG: hypothetical protein IPH30_04830 [Betaproteobacteria bacterium]|nr:hypothetical protein [Betaproteobacteria bacterium]